MVIEIYFDVPPVKAGDWKAFTRFASLDVLLTALGFDLDYRVELEVAFEEQRDDHGAMFRRAEGETVEVRNDLLENLGDKVNQRSFSRWAVKARRVAMESMIRDDERGTLFAALETLTNMQASHPEALTDDDRRLATELEGKLGVRGPFTERHEKLRRQQMAEQLRARELAREERIAAARRDPVVMPTRMCGSCGRKPAKVDELCKKCAHAAGTLVHGKIGAA